MDKHSGKWLMGEEGREISNREGRLLGEGVERRLKWKPEDAERRSRKKEARKRGIKGRQVRKINGLPAPFATS